MTVSELVKELEQYERVKGNGLNLRLRVMTHDHCCGMMPEFEDVKRVRSTILEDGEHVIVIEAA